MELFEPIDWVQLVEQIKAGKQSGMERLYELFGRGMRYYICRQLGPQELEDKVHDTFIIVVNAIRRGDLRNPECLMGFVRTVVRRQVAQYIKLAIHIRRNEINCTKLEHDGSVVLDLHENPEQEAILNEKIAIMEAALAVMSMRDRDVLQRFYLEEQTQKQVCKQMQLTKTQFRLLKNRAKNKLGFVGRRVLPGQGFSISPFKTKPVAKSI